MSLCKRRNTSHRHDVTMEKKLNNNKQPRLSQSTVYHSCNSIQAIHEKQPTTNKHRRSFLETLPATMSLPLGGYLLCAWGCHTKKKCRGYKAKNDDENSSNNSRHNNTHNNSSGPQQGQRRRRRRRRRQQQQQQQQQPQSRPASQSSP